MELQGQIDIFSTEQKPRMNVLIACEESQVVCKAFRLRGHRAFSCDLQECSGGHPEWHIQGDCLSLINGNCTFKTADTHTHRWGKVLDYIGVGWENLPDTDFAGQCSFDDLFGDDP